MSIVSLLSQWLLEDPAYSTGSEKRQIWLHRVIRDTKNHDINLSVETVISGYFFSRNLANFLQDSNQHY